MEYPELPIFEWKGPVYAIGLTGAIGSGKSTAGRAFAAAGVVLADADRLAHEALADDSVKAALREAFGDGIFDEAGAVHRPALGAAVFGAPEKLSKLNAIVHPEVRRRYEAVVAELEAGSIFVYDVPLLFEGRLESDFDLTVVISVSEEERYRRVEARNGWSREEFRRRDSSQLALSEKEKRADLVIKNEAGPEALHAAVSAVTRAIREARPEP